MDDGRKRVLLFAASILAAHNPPHWNERLSPALQSRFGMQSWRSSPQMLEWFGRLDTKLVCEFLERWSSLEELKNQFSNIEREAV